MNEDKRKNLSPSAKRRLRKKEQEAKRAKRRPGNDNWHDGAKVAVLTGESKSEHAAAVLKVCLRLKSEGVKDPRKLLSHKTPGGSLLTYVG